jgi:hypothetical protein
LRCTIGALVALASIAPLLSKALVAQCAPDTGSARPFGPRVTPSDSGRMYSSVLSPDGREFLYFKRVGKAAEDYRIFRSRRNGSMWGAAQQLSLGGAYADLYPSLSPDGTRLVFASYRPVPGDTSGKRNAHLWMVRRNGDDWGEPEFIRGSKLGHYHSGLTQDSTGTLHFRLTTPDWREQNDVALSWHHDRFASEIASDPIRAVVEHWRQSIGDSLYVWGAVRGPDRLWLLSVSRITQPGNRRSPAHYFFTHERLNGWTSPEPARGGLSVGAPNFAWFSSDGCYVHFTSDYFKFLRVPVRVAATAVR